VKREVDVLVLPRQSYNVLIWLTNRYTGICKIMSEPELVNQLAVCVDKASLNWAGVTKLAVSLIMNLKEL
jgi:hypothetical protein